MLLRRAKGCAVVPPRCRAALTRHKTAGEETIDESEHSGIAQEQILARERQPGAGWIVHFDIGSDALCEVFVDPACGVLVHVTGGGSEVNNSRN